MSPPAKRGEVSDADRAAIENGVKLDNLIGGVNDLKQELRTMREHQAAQATDQRDLVTTLREHDTIAKTDAVDKKVDRVTYLLGIALGIPPILYVTHNLWHWPT